MIEHTFKSEREAHAARREMIAEGKEVSLIGYDTEREVYAFDSYA